MAAKLFPLFVLLALTAAPSSMAMQSVNCFGSSPVTFSFEGFDKSGPKFVNGNPAATSDLWADHSMPVNFTVAFLGDSGKDLPAIQVLQLIKSSGAHMAIHSGDFDYVNSPDLFEANLNSILGPDFPYFQGIGNHDCLRWSTPGGYQEKIWNRLQRIKANVTCLGEVGTNMVCSYKGLVFVMTSYGTSKPTCWNYCDGCPETYGQTVFIEKAFRAFPSIWRVCSWHKNHHLYQIGTKYTEVGLPLYDACRKFGAIVTTGHEHSYSRTKRMSSFEDFTVAESGDTIVLNEGYSLAWVSGIGGIPLRSADDTLQSNHWWASTAAAAGTSTVSSYGAVFCKFNLNGELRKAFCETKLVDGRIIDSFYLASDLQAMASRPDLTRDTVEVCAEAVDIEVQVSKASDNAIHDTFSNSVQCGPDIMMMEHGNRVAFRFEEIGYLSNLRVNSAYLELVAAKEHAGNFEWLIYADKPSSGHSEPFECTARFDGSVGPNSLLTRNRTQATVSWTETNGKWYEGGVYKSPDISSVIAEVLRSPGWVKGNAITVFVEALSGSAAREPMTYTRDRCHAPTLTILFGPPHKTCKSHVLPTDVWNQNVFREAPKASTPPQEEEQRSAPVAVVAPPVENKDQIESIPSAEKTSNSPSWTRTEVVSVIAGLTFIGVAIFGAVWLYRHFKKSRDEQHEFMAVKALTANSEESDDELATL